MSIETLEDIAEEMADRIGIYGEDRSEFVPALISRMFEAARTEDALREARRRWLNQEVSDADMADTADRPLESPQS